jgi:hypothetical protein
LLRVNSVGKMACRCWLLALPVGHAVDDCGNRVSRVMTLVPVYRPGMFGQGECAVCVFSGKQEPQSGVADIK